VSAAPWRGRALIVRLSSLGDVVLATGPLRLLRARHPELSVDFLTRRVHAPALDGLPSIDRLRLEEDGPMAGNEGRYDLVLDWQGGRKGARACARFAPGARRIGHPRASLRRRLLVLLAGRIAAPRPYVARLARSVMGEWVDPADLRPEAPVDPDRRRRISAWLDRSDSPPAGWLVLAPGASRAMKTIPPGLADAIAASFLEDGWGVVRLRAPEPYASCCATSGPAAGGGRDLTYAGPLADVIALLAAARLFIGSDSGVLHLATAVGTPALGLFGCTVPELGFSPLGSAAAVGVDSPCRPCHVHGARRCWLGHRRCWADLSAACVRAEAAALLKG
jgi:ADP-heptose:LPS heptosyltransferase